MLKVLFWFFLIGSLYSYFLYPLILLLVKKSGFEKKASINWDNDQRNGVTLIITAYNEQVRIRKKIENTLKVKVPSEQFEIIVASDGSDDDTDAIVQEYSTAGVRLVRTQERLGKENAQLSAIQQAKGNILVFSDVATELPEDSLLNLVKYFDNPAVGAVSSEDRFLSKDGDVAGEGLYVKYEMWLRNQESQAAGLVGLSGSFFAARKQVCEQWDIHSPSDFNTALNCARLAYRAITAHDVLGYYQDLKDPAKEYSRKVRTVIRGMTALSRHPEVLNPLKYGLFAFQVISHKLMRWLVPWCLLVFFILSAVLSGESGIYGLAFFAQLVFYGLVLMAHYVTKLRDNPFVRLIYFFVQVNISLFDAACRFLSGTRMTTWKPSSR